MELFRHDLKIDFLGARRWAMPLTLTFIAISIGSMAFKGFNFGIDFTGGVVIEVGYDKPADLDRVRATLEQAKVERAVAQHFGSANVVLLRLPPVTSEAELGAVSDKVMGALKAVDASAKLRGREVVSPQVGKELTEQGFLAAAMALGGIFLYLLFRFEVKFALGAIAATVHDVIFTVGWFSIFGIEFDLNVLAAVLAVIGYSVNDTVVVFDRIRENFRNMRKATPEEVMNASVNQTMSRTVMTASTVFVVLVALLAWGGDVIHGFALALMIGLIVGTYSSIYIASATALMLGASRDTLMPPKKDDSLEEMP
jgi:preprotein translocase subunit SecF